MADSTIKPVKVVRLYPVLDFGGVETRARIQNRLYDRSEFDLEFWTFHRDGAAAEQIRSEGGCVRVVGIEPDPRSFAPTRRLIDLLEEHQPDLVHASIAEANLHGALAATAAELPVICEDVGQPSRSILGRAVFSLVWRLNDASIAVSKITRDWMVEKDRAPADRIRLIYNCALPEYFQPALKSFSATGELRVLIVGRLTEVKNQAMFIRAFADALEVVPGLSLVICGEGELRSELERLAMDLGISENVEFLGFVDRVRELLDQTDLFVLPSLSEGCSISLIEAMARGRMVLASDAGGNVEVLGEHARSRTRPIHDQNAWSRALVDHARMETEQRQEVGLLLRQFAEENYSPEKYVENLEELYREVLR